MKRQQDIQIILEDFKVVRNILGIKSAKNKVLITKIKNDKGECITSRKGIADVCGEFYKRLYEGNEKDDSEHDVNDDDNYSNTDVHNNDTEETPHLVLHALRAQERDEHALHAHLLRHDFRDLLGRPMKRMRDYFRRVGRAPRHFHCPFRGKQDATLFFLLRPVVAVLGAARCDPLSQFGLCLVLDDLLQQRFDTLDPAQNCLVDSLRRHVHGQCGQENTWRCGLPKSCSRRPLASTNCAYFLPASVMFLKGKDVSLGTSTTE